MISSSKENKETKIPQMPFDDALRKILNAPPAPNIKQKKEQQKKTAK